MDSAVISNSGRPGLGLGFQEAGRGAQKTETVIATQRPEKQKLCSWGTELSPFSG